MGDLRFAVRGLFKHAGSSVVAILSLALGIGATTALFSVIYGVLVSPYPYKEPDKIWSPSLEGLKEGGRGSYRLDEYAELTNLSSFSEIMATSPERMLLTGDLEPESLRAVRVTANAFQFLGVPPVVGRLIQPTDVDAGGEPAPVAVISFKMWQRLFGGERSALGKTLRLNNQTYSIIGVMPPRFGWWTSDGCWLPLGIKAGDNRSVVPITRLKSGTTPEAARQQLHAFHLALANQKPQEFPKEGFRTKLTNYMDMTVASGEMQRTLWLLFGAVTLLLFIACANVANLQLARASARVREMAIRLSIGANRGQLLRQLLTESVLLSVIGGAFGLLFAFSITRIMVRLMPDFYVPNEARIELNVWVLLFCLAVSMLTGILFGLVPALQSSKVNLTDALKDSTKGSGESAHAGFTRKALVIAEVALAVVLLVSAGLMIRTFAKLQAVELGFRPENIVTAVVPLPRNRYATLEQRNRFASEFLQRIESIPGVEAATIGNGGMPEGGLDSNVELEGAVDGQQRKVVFTLGAANYLKAVGIPLKRGRMPTEREIQDGVEFAVVNEATEKLWAGEKDLLGRRIKVERLVRSDPNIFLKPGISGYLTIIGVIGDTRNDGLRNPPAPGLFAPYTLVAPPGRTVAVRSRGDSGALIAAIKVHLQQIDKEQPLAFASTALKNLDSQMIQPRFTMALFGTFAVLGLALAALGIYSVLSFLVTRRTHEIGVRMALGAQLADILKLVLSTGGQLVSIGLVIGLIAAFAAARLLASQMFGIASSDPISYVGVVLILSVVALLACYIPARRAARVNPTEALRYE